jgi:putative two-component system response regulator
VIHGDLHHGKGCTRGYTQPVLHAAENSPSPSVLVVDDEETVRNLLSLICARAGARAELAENGKQAQTMLGKNRYAAALLDKNLPDMTGLQLLSHIKEQSPRTECLIVTGYASTDSAIEAVRLGAFDYIVKPFDVITVQHRVKLALERQRLADELEAAVATVKQPSESPAETPGERRRAYLDKVVRLSLTAASGEPGRDEEAALHVSRISRYAALLARAIDAQAGWVDDLALAAPLHDIGQVGVPDAILRKPGPLTRDERKKMQEHVGIGSRILAGASSDVLTLAREIVLTHHERWDGTGYPNHLRGEDIPLSGRIVALCDAWDALSTDRVYRKALGFDAAVAEVKNGAGKHFDPALVGAFLERLPQLRAVLEDPATA